MLWAFRLAPLLGLLGAMPLSAQDTVSRPSEATGTSEFVLTVPAPTSTAEEVLSDEAPTWQTAWGLAGLRGIPAGPKTAPNGLEFHPNFSLDLNLNSSSDPTAH